MALTLGHQRIRLMTGDGRTRAWYGLWAWSCDMPLGHLRIFEYGALVKDDIPDPINLWFQPMGAVGRMRRIEDDLPGRNTWKDELYADFAHRVGRGVRLLHRAKWSLAPARQPRADRDGRGRFGLSGRDQQGGVEHPGRVGGARAAFSRVNARKITPFSRRLPQATVLEETVFFILTQPLLAETVEPAYYPRYGRQILIPNYNSVWN